MQRLLIGGICGLISSSLLFACGETESDGGAGSGGTSSGGATNTGGKGGGSTGGTSSGGTSSGGTSSGGTSAGGTAGGSSTGGAPGDGGDICSLPKDSGPCEGNAPRWYFNTQTGKCELFSYGGCQGNANNFETAEACAKACAPTAAHPCEAIACDVGATCVYDSALPVCAVPCEVGGSGCPTGTQCNCAASCPSCKDCLYSCLGP